MSQFPKLNILISFPYFNKKIIAILKEDQSFINLLVDSGAFTAWKKNESVKLESFLSFLDQLKNEGINIWKYFMLDVIGDPEGTRKNLEDMVSLGYSPIPIFTRGEAISEINHLYERFDLIAVGGLVGTLKNRGYVKRIMREVGDRKIHWLGFTEQKFLPIYRPFSVDTSGWTGQVRYGGLKIYTRGGRWMTVRRDDFFKKPSEELQKIFEEYGEDLSRFKNKKEWTGADRLLGVMGAKSYVRYALDIERRFKTKFFLVCSTDIQIRILKDAYNYWRSYHEMRNDTFRRDGLNNPPISSLGTRA